jgi:hypothetical protein
MAVSPPPRKSAAAAPEPASRSTAADKKIDAIINRGSSAVVASPTEPAAQQLKNFNIKLPATTLAQIDEVRAKRPRKPTSPKLGISTQDWLLEAIAEKLEREQRKYKNG